MTHKVSDETREKMRKSAVEAWQRRKASDTGWTPPLDIDPECVRLCAIINQFAGICTTGSCCGHGRAHFNIHFDADSLLSLRDFLFVVCSCHHQHEGWFVLATANCHDSQPHFRLEGPVGGVVSANTLAAHLEGAIRAEAARGKEQA